MFSLLEALNESVEVADRIGPLRDRTDQHLEQPGAARTELPDATEASAFDPRKRERVGEAEQQR